MDPTEKVWLCLRISKVKGLAVIPELKKAIEQGANLKKQMNISGGRWPANTPLTYAIETECDPIIVQILKDASWDDSFRHHVIDYGNGSSIYPNHPYITITDILTCHIRWSPMNIRLFEEYAKIFGVHDKIFRSEYSNEEFPSLSKGRG